MMLGLVLFGSLFGAVSAVIAFCLGQSIWVSMLIYSGTGIVSVLTVVIVILLRASFFSRPSSGSRDTKWQIRSDLQENAPTYD